jgi:manganese transport protein
MSQLVHVLRVDGSSWSGDGPAIAVPPRSLSTRTVAAAYAALAGGSHGGRRYLAFAGPAIVASIAYMDPGNFATNIEAGSRYGYGLLWMVLLANLVAMLFQALSAKLGIVTGRNLAELSREWFPPPLVWTMWAVSEIAAMATDLAEFLGGAIGLSLLLKIPLLVGMVVTGAIVCTILLFQRFGFRPMELAIGGLVAAIGLSYLVEMLVAPVNWRMALLHTVLPQLADRHALMLAVGIIGATVMPHAVYLHSGLTQARIPPRTESEGRQIARASNLEVTVALAVAGLVNMAMVIMAAGAFHAGHPDVAEIATAYYALTPLLGAAAAGAFLVSLLASGVSSSVVGTLAGQMIMQGFVGFVIPIWLRRLVTMLPPSSSSRSAPTRRRPSSSARSCSASPCHFQWSRLCFSPGALTSWAASPTAARPKPRRSRAQLSCWRSTLSWCFKPLMCRCWGSSETNVTGPEFARRSQTSGRSAIRAAGM